MKRAMILACAAVLLSGVGCIRHQGHKFLEGPTRPLGQFGRVEVATYTNSFTPGNLKESDRQTIVQFAANVSDVTRNQIAGHGLYQGGGTSVLKIEGTLTSYRPSSKAAQWTVGYGAGEGHAIFKVTLKNGETGETIAVAEVRAAITDAYDNVRGRNEAAARIANATVRMLAANQ